MQMSTPDLIPSQETDSGVTWNMSVSLLLGILGRAKACHNAAGPHCLVRFVNSLSAVLGSHRVILYPQSFFGNKNTEVLCFRNKKTDIVLPLVKMLANVSGCAPPRDIDHSEKTDNAKHDLFFNQRQHSEYIPREVCERVQTIYRSDVLLWNRLCAKESTYSHDFLLKKNIRK
jgi:hypothetical protein